MSLLWMASSPLSTHIHLTEKGLDNAPPDGHGYPNSDDAADLEEWRSSPSGSIRVIVLIHVSAMPRISRDGASGSRNVEHELCDTLGAGMSDVLGPTEGDARERVGDL
jgi:hypothetical protein